MASQIEPREPTVDRKIRIITLTNGRDKSAYGSHPLEAKYRMAGWWRPEFIDDLVLCGHLQSAPALIDGNQALSRSALADSVAACATRLRNSGVRIGDNAVIQLPNSIGLFVLVLALIRIGARPVLALPALRDHELDPILAAARPVFLAIPREHRGFDHLAMSRKLKQRHASIRALIVMDEGTVPENFELEQLRSTPSPDPLSPPVVRRSTSDVALYLLSSGTTGAPKLIPRTHEAFGHVIRHAAEVSELNDSSVYLAALPATHSFTFGHPGVLGTLASGGHAILTDPYDTERNLGTIESGRVTHCAVVPAVLQRWLRTAQSGSFDTSSLKVIQVGGAPLSEATARLSFKVLGGRVQQVYGMSEGFLNFTRINDDVDTIVATQGRPSSPGDEVTIVDGYGAPVVEGETGELLVRGPGVITDYYGGISPESFTTDSFYRTGDLVRADKYGNLVVLGRVKDVINRGGEKIAAEEIEGIALHHSNIQEAAAVAMPHSMLGEVVCLYVVTSSGSSVTLADVHQLMELRGMARFKYPERLIEIDSLPLTGVGKVNKVALRADIMARLSRNQLPANS
ncbi:(2,3-dihydroxybenzoyl)adenylate synthase [Nocardia salmonicida]|uniref:(2,3-dihydroxybenzoyl)adenylate synthase n=1 Tax=Nocardia salmonicida TaxID=53431 RepID=UPI00379EE22C